MDEPDDTTIEALQARVDALKADEATQAGLKNRLDRLEKLSEQVDRVQAQVFVKRTPDAVEPQTAVERLAAAQQKYEALVDDPTAPIADVTRARTLRDRAQVAADTETARTAHFAAMGRSIEVKAAEHVERERLDAEERARTAAAHEAEERRKWSAHERAHYVRTGQGR